MTPQQEIVKEWSEIRPFGGFGLIMMDPPWKFQAYSDLAVTQKSPQSHYDCTPLEWIKALPIDALAAQDCALWLWATNPMLPQAFEVLQAWGFEFKTAGHWVKRTKTGKLAFGTGYVLRCAGEPFLIATRGKPKVLARNVRSVIEGPVRENSRKPDIAYSEAERLYAGPRADIFSRQRRPGWTAFGNQVDFFPPLGE